MPGWPILWLWNDFNDCAAVQCSSADEESAEWPRFPSIVNGNPVNANVDPRTLLVQFLRENLRLTGTHVGCDTSQCGACVVHLDGKAVKSCTTLAVMADGHEVRTIEGLAADGAPLHPMQEAFREHHGLQCGFCTPGMIMTAVDLVHRKGHDLDRPHHPRRARRQSLPLHRLSEHRSVDRGRRQGDGEVRSRVTHVPHGDQEYSHVRIQISSSGDRAAGRQSAGQERRRQGRSPAATRCCRS